MSSDYAYGITARREALRGAQRDAVVALSEDERPQSSHSKVIRGIQPDPSADLGVTATRQSAAPVERASWTPA